MKIATWNVNSLRVRLPQVLEWLARTETDVLALQETKMIDADFPVDALRAAGYHAAYAGQKTYNGVALLSRAEPRAVVRAAPGLDADEKRVIAADFGEVAVINLYVVNGVEVGHKRYDYKLAWLRQIADFVRDALARRNLLVVVGDFNIAPADLDVHDPQRWEGKILCSAPEREAFDALLALGLVDSFRARNESLQAFSWWPYWRGAFERDRGLRIDHILASRPLAERCVACAIDTAPRKAQRPSDHAPVVAEFDLPPAG